METATVTADSGTSESRNSEIKSGMRMAFDQNITENYDENISLDSQTFDQHSSFQMTPILATTTGIANNVTTTTMSSNDNTIYTNMVSNGITNMNSSFTSTVKDSNSNTTTKDSLSTVTAIHSSSMTAVLENHVGTTAICSPVTTTTMHNNATTRAKIDYTTTTVMDSNYSRTTMVKSATTNAITNHLFAAKETSDIIKLSQATAATTEIGTTIKTADGAEYSSANGDVVFVRKKRTVIPEQNAAVVNMLPVPALPGFDKNFQPSQRIGKMVKHPEFKKFSDRCNSFIDNYWPHENPSPYELAKASMFYSGPLLDNDICVSDQVTCYRCGATFRDWNVDDDPVTEHVKIYPLCFEETWIDGIYCSKDLRQDLHQHVTKDQGHV